MTKIELAFVHAALCDAIGIYTVLLDHGNISQEDIRKLLVAKDYVEQEYQKK